MVLLCVCACVVYYLAEWVKLSSYLTLNQTPHRVFVYSTSTACVFMCISINVSLDMESNYDSSTLDDSSSLAHKVPDQQAGRNRYNELIWLKKTETLTVNSRINSIPKHNLHIFILTIYFKKPIPLIIWEAATDNDFHHLLAMLSTAMLAALCGCV